MPYNNVNYNEILKKMTLGATWVNAQSLLQQTHSISIREHSILFMWLQTFRNIFE